MQFNYRYSDHKKRHRGKFSAIERRVNSVIWVSRLNAQTILSVEHNSVIFKTILRPVLIKTFWFDEWTYLICWAQIGYFAVNCDQPLCRRLRFFMTGSTKRIWICLNKTVFCLKQFDWTEIVQAADYNHTSWSCVTCWHWSLKTMSRQVPYIPSCKHRFCNNLTIHLLQLPQFISAYITVRTILPDWSSR